MIALAYAVLVGVVLSLAVISYALYRKGFVRAGIRLRSFVFFIEADNNDKRPHERVVVHK
jgi:hypothetical protein